MNAHLQSVAHPDIFGGGDCASLEGHALAKVGVYAVRQNPILFHNLKVALEGGEMISFMPPALLFADLQHGERPRHLLEKGVDMGWQACFSFEGLYRQALHEDVPDFRRARATRQRL